MSTTFRGKPCKACGGTLRYASSKKQCVACQRKANRKVWRSMSEEDKKKREDRKAYMRARYAANPDYWREYRRNNPEIIARNNSKARAKRLRVHREGGFCHSATKDAWWEAGRCCELCACPIEDRKHLTLDHAVPLIRGGDDSRLNAVPAHYSCNCQKNRRTLAEWFGFTAEHGWTSA